MKTEISNIESEAAESRKLSDNYRVITGYPSDNSHPETTLNAFAINDKDAPDAQSQRQITEAESSVAVEQTPTPSTSADLTSPHHKPAAALGANTRPSTDPVDFVRQLIPPSLRKRRFRADSFMAKLTLPQRALVISWLQQETALAVQAKIAAPAPAGFGMEVHTSALYRLRNLISNTELNAWIENAMDATYDILEADTSVDTAPMREALSLLLHGRIMTYVREQTNPASIDRLLSALTRLEKLKTHIAQRPNLIAAPREKTTRHKVDVQITTHQGTPTPITIRAVHETQPMRTSQIPNVASTDSQLPSNATNHSDSKAPDVFVDA